MIQLRPAVASDGEDFLSLVHQLAEFEKLEGPDAAACDRLLEHAFGASPKFELFMIDLDGEAVGYAACFVTYSTFRALPSFFLEDLFVAPAARRMGVGRRALAELRRIAEERGCGRLEWHVLDWNENAQKLYESVGARRQGEWFLYRVDLP